MMKRARNLLWTLGLCLISSPVFGQNLQFSFDDLPAMRSLPMDVSAGGLTAHLSATGQGFSIQSAGVLGFTPAGFSGNSIYPNSVYAADLQIHFSLSLSRFSIMYSPEEYACDSSARMRVTAFWNGLSVGTSTATAAAGTWPTGTLKIVTVHPFNSVVVHYDAPPPTGGDWGPVFMADNMSVTLDTVPYAVSDQYSLSLNSTLNVAVANGLLKNDLIATGATAVLVSGPLHGSVKLLTDGSFSYTPALGFVGTDRFVYEDVGSGQVSNPTSVTLLVQPKLANFTLNPVLLLGGTTLSGTLNLSVPAPAGGTRVFLSDDCPSLFEAASVLVPTGATSAPVSVSSKVVASKTLATVAAKLNSDVRTIGVALYPLSPLKSISVNPVTVMGGTRVVGTVTLTVPVPVGAESITVSSDNPLVVLPALVTVSAGKSVINFYIMTPAVKAATKVTIRASLNGVVQTATLNLK